MPEAKKSINALFGERLGKFKKRANISIARISYATSISVNYITDTINGKRNPTLSHVESYAKLFGVPAFELLNFDASIPSLEVLQQNIRMYFKSLGYNPTPGFKKLGPAYIVEEFIEESAPFGPLDAAEIKNLCNQTKGTSYKTNDVSRILNNLAEEGILYKTETGNAKKPAYKKVVDK